MRSCHHAHARRGPLCDACSRCDQSVDCTCDLLAQYLRTLALRAWSDREQPVVSRQRREASLLLELQRIDLNLQRVTATFAPIVTCATLLAANVQPYIVVVLASEDM